MRKFDIDKVYYFLFEIRPINSKNSKIINHILPYCPANGPDNEIKVSIEWFKLTTAPKQIKPPINDNEIIVFDKELSKHLLDI